MFWSLGVKKSFLFFFFVPTTFTAAQLCVFSTSSLNIKALMSDTFRGDTSTPPPNVQEVLFSGAVAKWS